MRRIRAFTLIELLVTLAIIATLLTFVAPNYFRHLDKSKEVVLKENLSQVRDAIDKFKADKERYPADLKELVSERYLRQYPYDPVAERSDAWIILPAPETASGVYDLKSGATGNASDGTAYASW